MYIKSLQATSFSRDGIITAPQKKKKKKETLL